MGAANGARIASVDLGRLWALTAPIRAYLRHSPVDRGKGWLIRRVMRPLLPRQPLLFAAPLPGGAVVRLSTHDDVGLVTLLYGGFEIPEIKWAITHVTPGSVAFDVGANVGVYSAALAKALRSSGGAVVAVEPDPRNIAMLRANLALNDATNVRVIEAAASDSDGVATLELADDPAYHSITSISRDRKRAGTLTVMSVTLDGVWSAEARPPVSLIKIDVEGAEIRVLEGASELIGTRHPPLLVEANDERRLLQIRELLEPLGYVYQPQRHFRRWNHLFLHR